MCGYNVDLRDLPWYFWLGLALEALGAILLVVFSASDRPGEIAALAVFIVGMALSMTAFIFRQRRDRKADRDAAAKEGQKPRKGARALGTFLICVGVFGAATSIRARDGRFGGLAMAVLAMVVGIMYLYDRGLVARDFRATGPESPLALRLAVHAKYFLAMVVCAGVILAGCFFRPAGSATMAEKIWWWVFIAVAVLSAAYYAGKYIWHCWIKRDYKEPEFRPG